MAKFWTEEETFTSKRFANEAELEAAVVRLQVELFGRNRIYLDIKRRIGVRGVQQNIPDGYLIDLSGPKPRLFVVENELAVHDPLRHIAVQILQFSLAFEAEPRLVRNVLMQALEERPDAHRRCTEFAVNRGFRNLDHMLEWLVADSPFAALIIIDEIPDKLEAILARKFQFGVEVLQLATFASAGGKIGYEFDPFLADLVVEEETRAAIAATGESVLPLEIDTIVVPAREDGFQETFLGEDRWYSVRIHGAMRDQLRYLAIYRIAPISAITHIAPIRSLEPWKDSGKWVINLAEHAQQIGPIVLNRGGKVRNFQNLRYANREALLAAATLDDVWK